MRANNRAGFGVHHSDGLARDSLAQNVLNKRLPQTTKKEALVKKMATYRDPVRVFAPLEVIERLLEIRAEAGYSPSIFLRSTDDLAQYLDAYGFDIYQLMDDTAEFQYGRYRASIVPGGDHAHCSATAH